MTERDLSTVFGWCRQGEHELTERAVVPLDLEEPSALPNWTRGHLIAHLARNADALVNLVNWAKTGVVTQMYPSPEARGEQIDADLPQPAAWLRERLAQSSARLLAELATMTPANWQHEVGTAQGRTVPASEIPWMRVRESYIHLVDLDLGFAFSDIPDDVTDALLDDVTAAVGSRDECPPVVIEPTDRERTWTLGDPGASATVLRAPASELLEWVTGRTGGDSPALTNAPEIPRWL